MGLRSARKTAPLSKTPAASRFTYSRNPEMGARHQTQPTPKGLTIDCSERRPVCYQVRRRCRKLSRFTLHVFCVCLFIVITPFFRSLGEYFAGAFVVSKYMGAPFPFTRKHTSQARGAAVAGTVVLIRRLDRVFYGDIPHTRTIFVIY